MVTPDCGAANLGRSRLLGGQSRLKAGCGQDCPPSSGASFANQINLADSAVHAHVYSGIRRSGGLVHPAVAALVEPARRDLPDTAVRLDIQARALRQPDGGFAHAAMHPHIDIAACTRLGLMVCSSLHPGTPSYATAELT